MMQELIGYQSNHEVNCFISSGQKHRRPGSQIQFSLSYIEEVYAMMIATVFEADESESSRQDILAGLFIYFLLFQQNNLKAFTKVEYQSFF